MSTSTPVTVLTVILIASLSGIAIAGPPTPADADRQSGASRQGGARVEPVHLPTGPVGNQQAPAQRAPSPPTAAIPTTPHYQNSQRQSAQGAASNAAGRRRDAALDQEGGDKLDQSSIQQVTSEQAEAERLEHNVAKKTEDRAPKRTSDAIFGPSAPRGPTQNASGASRSSTIGASGIVPPDDPNN